ncbi:peroxiredoxin [Arthrobacter sp. GCM10027362]|uniref:peroxiredoxin n=1 Tax=Arthrobacter sp. GCM10027362 TaxID=3273379 RepID=UPI003624B6BC
MTLPAIGQPAPDFELSNQFGETIRLSDLRGGNVVVVFYPFAFSGICTGELCALRDDLGVFRDENARVLAVSVDHKFALRAFAEHEGYEFDLLADFWPHGGVAKAYGVFNETSGMAGRGTFIIDAEGILRHVIESPRAQARDIQEYHRVLKEL